jgi:TRAP-type C4-dicarboxylate transport system substrate-binding protein
LAKGKIKIMIPFYEGEMAAYLRKGVQPLLTNADWKGKKIRVPNKERAKLITSIGASAVVIPIGEVAMALQRGTVDGVLTGWPVGRAIKLEESAPNVTIINCATAQFGFAGMNMDTFERLSPADQQIMIQAGKEAGVFNGKLVEELREQYIQKIKGEGITPHFFSSQDIEAFLGKGYALMDESMKNASQEQVELYEILKQFRSQ